MAIVSHPSSFADINLLQVIRDHAAHAEVEKQLHTEQCKIIYEQKWLKMYLPKSYNGMGYSLEEGLRLLESIAWADGSTAWVTTLCSGANWFLGFLNPLLHPYFFDERLCMAGSGQSTGTAEKKGSGYEINGHWKYATGSFMATHFTANCMIFENGHQLNNEKGLPLIKSFLFLKEEVRVIPSWNSMGMVATGSQSFAVANLQIPFERRFDINEKATSLNDPIFRYPFLQFAETSLAINLSGMAIRFFDLFEQKRSNNLKTNPSPSHQKANEHAIMLKQQLMKQRNSFYEAVANSWNLLMRQQRISDVVLELVSTESRKLAKIAVQVTDTIYPYCGMAATDPSTEINRVWRNLHTASQHSLLAFS